GMFRPVVAVGRDFIYETNTGQVLAYKRNVDANGSINGTSLPMTPMSNELYQSIFSAQTQQYDAELVTINQQYAGSNMQKPLDNCTSTDTTYCAKDWYDGDTVYDEYSGHFFMMTKVRRLVWSCTNIGLTPPTGYTAGWNDGHRTNGVLDHPC